MKSLDYIPTNKIARASNLVSTGFKLGGNYLKYYGEKALNVDGSRKRLDEENAKDIYNSLKTLKGSALKVAQMLSMEKNLLPRAYVDQFSLSQFSVPPLSWPLVNNMIRKYQDINLIKIDNEINIRTDNKSHTTESMLNDPNTRKEMLENGEKATNDFLNNRCKKFV